MKLIKHLALSATLLATGGAAFAQCSAGSTLIVGPSDQYAFRWCNGTTVTNIGLNFASSVNEYQFKKLDGSNVMTINPVGSAYIRMGAPDAGNHAQFAVDGDLTFSGNADYLVGNNRYAFRSEGNQNNGLFFNVAQNQYEFRDNGAAAGLAIKANTAGGNFAGDLIGNGGATFNRQVVASGPSGQPAAVKGIGQFAPTNGYLGVQGTADFDGIVGLSLAGQEIGAMGVSTGGTVSDNYGVYGYSNNVGIRAAHSGNTNRADLATSTRAGFFNGDIEVTGNIIGNLAQPTLAGVVTITGGNNNTNTIGALKVTGTSTFSSSVGFDNNEMQIYNSTDSAAGTLFLNFYGGNMDVNNAFFNPNGVMNVGSGNLVVSNVSNSTGIGTASPSGKLHVSQTTAGRVINAVYNATSTTGSIFNFESTNPLSSANDLLQLVIPQTSSTTAQFIEAETSGTGGGIRFQVNGNGHIGVGTSASNTHAIQACGSIRATEVIVETGWCDYVFEDDYQLAPLSDVEKYIKANKHLPGIPAAAEIEANGVKVAEMSSNFMLKIEELTLYTIAQEKQIDAMQAQIEELKALISAKQ